jgi:hypothetical protein
MATKKKASTKKATAKKAPAKKKAAPKKAVMKKAAPKKKVTAKKSAPKKKPVTRKAAAKKPAVKKKAAAPTATDQVLKIIARSKKGVDVPTLMKKTRFEEKKVRNIVTRAFSQKKIKRVTRGIYVTT